MMTEQGSVCYTLTAAMDKALEMENDSFRTLLLATHQATDPSARGILHDTATAKLKLKTRLEEAMLAGRVDDAALQSAVPTMNLDFLVGLKTLKPVAGAREALAFCIHLVSGAVAFYHNLGSICAHAPMGPVFKRLGDDQTTLLRSLETDYEEHFLTEN